MSTAARQLVGRDEELGTIVGLLDAADQLPGAAVLPGEAGIGKTTLWQAGIEAASTRGYRILSSRPSGAETRFSFAGLADLLGGADEIVADLPPIQRRALEAALLLGDTEIDADERAVAAAFLAACEDSPATVHSASRSTTSSGWTLRRSRRSATRSPAWIVSRSPRCWRSAARSRSGSAAPFPRIGSSRSKSPASASARPTSCSTYASAQAFRDRP